MVTFVYMLLAAGMEMITPATGFKPNVVELLFPRRGESFKFSIAVSVSSMIQDMSFQTILRQKGMSMEPIWKPMLSGSVLHSWLSCTSVANSSWNILVLVAVANLLEAEGVI